MVDLEKRSRYVRLGKFGSARDEVLYHMDMDAWSMESDGNVDAPTGFFAMMENLPNDMEGIIDAFPDELNVMVEARESFSNLIGWFLLYHDDQGFFSVVEYNSLSDLRGAFRDLQAQYEEWGNNED